MEGLTFPSIIVRVSVMYGTALTLIRISGKQSIGELSTMDLVVTNLLGDAFDTVIFGEVPILQGVVYFTSVALLHILVTFLTSRSPLAFRLLSSPARLMIENGRVSSEALRRERMRPETVASDLRLKKVDHVEEVQDAMLEPSGQMSVIKKPSSKPVQKKDLGLLTPTVQRSRN